MVVNSAKAFSDLWSTGKLTVPTVWCLLRPRHCPSAQGAPLLLSGSGLPLPLSESTEDPRGLATEDTEGLNEASADRKSEGYQTNFGQATNEIEFFLISYKINYCYLNIVPGVRQKYQFILYEGTKPVDFCEYSNLCDPVPSETRTCSCSCSWRLNLQEPPFIAVADRYFSGGRAKKTSLGLNYLPSPDGFHQ